MSRLGDIESAIVARLAETLKEGAPVFATVRGFSGGYRPALRDAIRRERLPAAYVAFTDEQTAMGTTESRRGPTFVVLIAARMLRQGEDARHGDPPTMGAFELIDHVRNRLDNFEPGHDTLLLSILQRFVDADDRVVVYEAAYRAWPYFVALGGMEDLSIVAPRMIGTPTDHILLDPANASYTMSGLARPTQRLAIVSPSGSTVYNIPTVTLTQLTTNSETSGNIPAVQVSASNDGGWRSDPIVIPEWCDVSEEAELIVAVQAAASATGDVSLRADWDLARAGEIGVSEGSAGNVIAGPTSAGEIMHVSAGTIGGGTFEAGDVVGFAVRRMAGTDAADTYSQNLLIARAAWLAFKRNRL